MMNDPSLFRWRWKSVLFNALWCHKLRWCHIRNRLIRVREGCTFHWCIDCGKYCCLICRGRKLLGWPSYDFIYCLLFTCESTYCWSVFAIAMLSLRPSMRLFVHLSHGFISQKRCKLGSPNLHHRLLGWLWFQDP